MSANYFHPMFHFYFRIVPLSGTVRRVGCPTDMSHVSSAVPVWTFVLGVSFSSSIPSRLRRIESHEVTPCVPGPCVHWSLSHRWVRCCLSSRSLVGSFHRLVRLGVLRFPVPFVPVPRRYPPGQASSPIICQEAQSDRRILLGLESPYLSRASIKVPGRLVGPN